MGDLMRLVVCAAIRSGDVIICGARHSHCLTAALKHGFDGINWECGFIDQHNCFITRQEAWRVADAAGQIRRPTGFEQHYTNTRVANICDEGLLLSENLY